MSPQGKFVATLDITGCLHIFKLDKESCLLSSFVGRERLGSQATNTLSNGQDELLSDIVDFTWWSDHIITLAKRGGIITMLDIFTSLKLQANDPVYLMPVLERVQQFQGQIFVIESKSSEERKMQYNHNRESADSHHIEQTAEDACNQFDVSQMCWSLISMSQRSVPEMYNILISNHKYQVALDFANRHGLDSDEVLKSQWLNSGKGVSEINMFLSNIKDIGFILSECVDKVGPTEDAVKALIAYGMHVTDQSRFTASRDHEGSHIWHFRMARLRLLQFRDRLETYLGINMGRYFILFPCGKLVADIIEIDVFKNSLNLYVLPLPLPLPKILSALNLVVT